MARSLPASPWMIASGIGALVAGVAHVVLQAHLFGGGGLSTVRRAMSDRREDVAAVCVVDFVGGLIVAATAVLVGVTEPRNLVSFVNEWPLFGWAMVGVLGPFVATWIFAGSAVQGRFEGWVTSNKASDVEMERKAGSAQLKAQAWRLRREAVHAVEMRAWVLVQRALDKEAERLLTGGRELIATDLVRARRLVRLTKELDGKGGVPTSVGEAASRITGDCSDESLAYLLDALLNELVDSQTWYPLEVLLGDASEGRRLQR